ncbi:MAG: hypothetical protein JST60_19345 [Chloroflexi bacterium SZAS-1]|nr:hypothetical protein [Chloroflexi bacterium SZAS-1]
MSKLPHDPQLRKLEMFRQNFLFLISDGTYPPHRQQRLFQWCQQIALDWDEARAYIAQDSTTFLKLIIGHIIADGRVTPLEVASLHKLQRRLGLGQVRVPPVEQLYDVVERKIEAMLIERAAYLSSPGLITSLTQKIADYHLPEVRQQRLLDVLARQHELAKLMAGQLPIVQPQIDLYADEICHLDIDATFAPAQAAAKEVSTGRLVVTNLRIMVLSPQGGLALPWPQVHAIVPLSNGITILGQSKAHTPSGAAGEFTYGTVCCPDPQYIATLIGAARRIRLTPTPQPIPTNKRLLQP